MPKSQNVDLHLLEIANKKLERSNQRETSLGILNSSQFFGVIPLV